MGLRAQFETDSKLETKGVVLDYGTTRITIARAGGANKKYAKFLERATQPYRRAIENKSFDRQRSEAILHETYARTIILGWTENVGTAKKPQWKSGINPDDLGVDGKELLPASVENIMTLFERMPDLFLDIKSQAEAGTLFREEILEADTGN